MDEITLMKIKANRDAMKGSVGDGCRSDQLSGVSQPPMHLTREYIRVIPLTRDHRACISNNDLFSVMNSRSSHRAYTGDSLSLEELSWLLWITQGQRQIIGKRNKASMRTVPSAGARHPLETYLYINRVTELESGLYHYIVNDHSLGLLRTGDEIKQQIVSALSGQSFYGEAAVGFIWSAVPYRSEWRYGVQGPKYTLLDAGHVCQNLYLAAASIGCGACAIGDYIQQQADELFGLDSSSSSESGQEFVVYAAAVGKLEQTVVNP